MSQLLRFAIVSITVFASAMCTITRAQENEPPAASVDLMTPDGVSLVQGAWRYKDVELTRVAFHAAGVDGQPTGAVG